MNRLGLLGILVLIGLGLALYWLPNRSAVPVTNHPIGLRVEEALRQWSVPGCVVLVVDRDQILYFQAHGRRHFAREQPLAKTHLFPMASCTKAFTTTLLAMLVEDGTLHWDDRVRQHLPDFHLADAEADRQATLRDLLTHRCGVEGHDLLWYHAPWDIQESIRRLGKVAPSYPFRGGFAYQSILVAAAGLAATQTAGRPWESLMQARIFTPLGMTSAVCHDRQLSPAQRPIGHRQTLNGRLETVPWYPLETPNPAGTILLAAADLAPWLRLHLNQGRHADQQLIAANVLAETHQPQTPIPLDATNRRLNPDTKALAYGMGWVVRDHRGHRELAHAGKIDGFLVHLTLLPDAGYGLAILGNLERTRMNLALSNTLVDYLLDLPPQDWHHYFQQLQAEDRRHRQEQLTALEQSRQPDQEPSLPLEAYAGIYHNPAYGQATIQHTPAGLRWQWSSFERMLDHHHGDVFRIRDPHLLQAELLTFTRMDGQVGSFHMVGVGQTFQRNLAARP